MQRETKTQKKQLNRQSYLTIKSHDGSTALIFTFSFEKVNVYERLRK